LTRAASLLEASSPDPWHVGVEGNGNRFQPGSHHRDATAVVLGLVSRMSRGEVALVVFVFALVWAAGALPRFGDRLGALWDARSRKSRDGD
jgi:hypothetical protein